MYKGSWPQDGRFSEGTLVAYVDHCLSQGQTLGSPSARVTKLRVSSIANRLSAIRTCFSFAGLPNLVWPDLATRQLAVECSAHRQVGVEKHFEKPPLMPRVLLVLESYLVLVNKVALQSILDLTFFIAALGLLMAFFFGWRDDTFL